jgi:hypothetical protein
MGPSAATQLGAIGVKYTNASNYGDMAFATRGSGGFGERMRIDSNGNVGIGTTAPTTGTRLDITGTGAAASSIIIPRDTVANRPTAGVNGMIRYATDSNKFEAYENGAWVNLIGGGGSLSWPLLATSTGTSTAPAYSFSSDTDTGMFSPGANQLALATAGTAALTIDSSANVSVAKRIVAGVSTNSNSLSAITADFSSSNLIRSTAASSSCSTLNVTNTALGGNYTITLLNATTTCTTIQFASDDGLVAACTPTNARQSL